MSALKSFQRIWGICLVLLWLLSWVASAQPYPSLGDSFIYFIDASPNAYQNLSNFLTEHNAKSSLKAYVVIVKEILENNSELYIDRLSAAWQAQRPNFIEQDYLILALGLNHVIEMKFAGGLEARYGATGKSLLDRFYDSDWLPYAKSGDYEVGLKNLITRVEAFFKTEDARKAEQAKRAEEAKKAAEARNAEWQYFQTTVLPWILFGLIALLLAGILLALRQRNVSARRRVAELLTKTKERLALAQSHLNEFYEKYKLLFEIDGEVIYKGRTFESYQSTSKLVNRLQLGVQLLAQQVAKAENLLKSESFIGSSKFSQAEIALTDEKVTLTTDEVKAGKVKLFSSMNFSLEAQVSQLMDSLENYFAEAQTGLDEIWNAILQSGPAVAKAKELSAQIESQLNALKEASVTLEQYENKRASIISRLAQAEQILKTDPLSTREQASQIQQDLQALNELLTSMLQVEANSRERAKQLEALRTRIATLRTQGFLLQEEGGPDPLCDHAAEGLKALRQAFDNADKEKATTVLDELTQLLNFIGTKLDHTVEAKEKIPGEAENLRDHIAELQQLAKETAPALDELKKNFAPDSFKTESDNINEVTEALEQCEKHIALALSKAEPKCQEYLGAMELLTQVDQAQKQCEALLNAIPNKLKELQNAREQAQVLHTQITQNSSPLAQFIKENSFSISSETDGRFSELQNQLQQLTPQLSELRPDWPALLQQLQGLSQMLSLIAEQARHEQETFQKLSQLSPQLQSQLAATKKFLDEHTEDRAEANSDYQKAHEFFSDIQAGLKQGKANWAELTKKAIRATELNELALSLAKKDVELYEKAMHEVRDAQGKVETSTGQNFGYGVNADLFPARQALNSALSALRVGNYEQALQLAEASERTAAHAVNTAYDQAQQMQEEFYRQRRNAEMARTAMTVAGLLLSSGVSRRSSWGGGGGIGFGGFSGGGGSSWGSSSGSSGGWSSSSGRRTW
ncbi:hypothetical protein HYR54_12735 [Candidatus Acetothermia bacterium]|nr:hypothetical protein [Candidatus Acetothermia bacterium]